LYIVGRAKEVIVDSGGNNIYIEELEENYGRSQYVKEMAVVGLKVGQGEQVAALVVPAYARGESRRAVEDRLRTDFDRVGRELSAHKRIRILRFTDAELPRTRTRKIKRADVAATLRRMLDVRPNTIEAEASNSEVETWLAEALAAIATEPVNIAPETRLIEDLGLDSLALAEIGELIGERASRDIAPEEIADLRTVADLQLLAAQPGGNGRPRMPSYAKFADPYTPRLPGPLKWLGRFAVRGAERALFDGWLKPKILGRGNVPANRNFIVVANHSSHLDFSLVGYALGAIGEDMRVLAAKDYFFNTPARRFLAANFTSLMPFDRERAQLESLEDALAELAQGRSVLMFPEGTRSADGAIHEFKSGAGFLALRSRCDVLPVLIRGTHDVMGKGSLVPRRHPVEVRIGHAITASELREVAASSEGAGAYRKIADLMRTAVFALSGSRSKVTLTPETSTEPSRSPEAAKQSRAKTERSPEQPRGHAKA
jgi:long-chain acyl-CoA synthetase